MQLNLSLSFLDDPVYYKHSVDVAGMCQSILYEVLYSEIFKVEDCMEATDRMLFGDFGNEEKPDELIEADFIGTAMQALETGKIPFPYKGM